MSRILIVHYHLNPGGVTRIIESQVQALNKFNPSLEIIVLTGYCENSESILEKGAKLIIEPKLNYLPDRLDYNAEYNVIRNFFLEKLKTDDVLHVHNLNLGKNPILTLVISTLAIEGYKVLNHVHDFAEDRPANYKYLKEILKEVSNKPLAEILYPDLKNMTYAVLNSVDIEKLYELGVSDNRIYLLPNPIVMQVRQNDKDLTQFRELLIEKLKLDRGKKIITYPVRVIRRKNVGEYILLCYLLSQKANWLITQPPRNPIEVKPYLEWKRFCIDHAIPVIFEAGVDVDFESLIRVSDYCFTTSIMEGFGMVYLEPWLLGTPVIGRNLNNITSDLRHAGVVFPLLYDSINVVWNGKETDFATLQASEQMQYISDLITHPLMSKELFSQNKFLGKLLNSVDQNLIDKNKAIILQEFSLENYAKRLETIYQKITR